MPSFAKDPPKSIKPSLGRTRTAQTPLDIHSKFPLDEGFRSYVRDHLGRALDPYAMRIARVSIHFEDINGSKGGVDTRCRVNVTLGHDEPVIIEESGTDAKVALDLATHRVVRNVQKHIERHFLEGRRSAPPEVASREERPLEQPTPDDGSPEVPRRDVNRTHAGARAASARR